MVSHMIILRPANIDHMYSNMIVDLQFLPNCIRDIIYQYSQDSVYTFIKMMLDSSSDNESKTVYSSDIISQFDKIYTNRISAVCVYKN